MLDLNEILKTPQLTGRNLYHYTTQDGFLGIVKSRSLWTTSVLHLNDSTEFSYTLRLVRERITPKVDASHGSARDGLYKQILTDLRLLQHFTLYVGSFSEHGDLLSQWRAYTHSGIGFSLGFKDTTLQSLSAKQGYRLVKCIYDPYEHEKIVSGLIEIAESSVDRDAHWEHASNKLFENLVAIAPLLKNPAFREEREWRVVSQISMFMKGESEFRAGKSMLIPYCEFKLEHEGSLKIAEIYLGPTPNVQLAQASLLQLNACKKLGNPFVVQVSQVPYRPW